MIDLDEYGADWPQFSHRIRFERADGRCECRGECGSPSCLADLALSDPLDADPGRCKREHGDPISWHVVRMGIPGLTGKRLVVLTTAHLCNVKSCRDEGHVRAYCQRCHLHTDRHHHARNASRTRDARAGQERLFP